MDVVVNAAMSVDGKLSTRRRERVDISGPSDFDRVHRLRSECDGIMVGIGTVLADDPSLLIDDPDRRAERVDAGRPPNPVRAIADSRARTPPDATVLTGDARTLILVADRAPVERIERLEAAGATVIASGRDRVDPERAMETLKAFDVSRLLVEGGGELIFSLFEAGVVDELSVFIGPHIIGGRSAPTLADGSGFVDPGEFPRLSLEGYDGLDDGVLIRWSVKTGVREPSE